MEIKSALAALGVREDDLSRILTLEELKSLLKTNYRKLAFEFHPDRNGGDSKKTVYFRQVTNAWDFLKENLNETQFKAVKPKAQIDLIDIKVKGSRAKLTYVYKGIPTILHGMVKDIPKLKIDILKLAKMNFKMMSKNRVTHGLKCDCWSCGYNNFRFVDYPWR